MGKHGPCYHCGVTSTPLWRNGPSDKPVLCNACGSRWRTKGTLANYTPLHKREALELEMPKKPKESTHLKLKLKKVQKAQWSNKIPETESGIGDYGHIFTKGVDEDTSNRSSSGSAVSFSESCANFSGADVSEVTGSLQTNAWETVVPSRKRTGMVRLRHSSVEKLTKDLHSILNEQSSYLTASSEDLLYESNTSTGLIEIGNGSVLLRHPNSASVEEESEASSLPLRNKSTCAELLLMTDCQSKTSTVSDMCNMKIRSSSSQEQLKRDKASQEKIHILRNKESQLGSIDLHDIICLDGYMKYLTNEEQQHLTRYLPSVDTTNPPESLKSMFTCSQIAQSFSSFQHLLQEGIFDLSTSGINSDDCKNLRKLILSNLTKAAWVESYKTLKDARHNPKDSKKGGQGGTTFLGHSSTTSLKRPHESYNDNFEEPKVMKCIKKSCSKTMHPSLPSMKSIEQNPGELAKKPKIDYRSHIESKCSGDSPETPPVLSSRKGCIFNPMQLTDSNPDEDLLVDVRSTTSFPEAELLSDAWLQSVPSKSSCGENGAPGKEDSFLCHSAVSFTSDLPKKR